MNRSSNINQSFKFKRTAVRRLPGGNPRCPCGKKSTRVLTDARGDRYYRCEAHFNDCKPLHT